MPHITGLDFILSKCTSCVCVMKMNGANTLVMQYNVCVQFESLNYLPLFVVGMVSCLPLP